MTDKKSLFNFYLDENVKKDAIAKLERVVGSKQKGQLASLIRVMLKQFVATPDDKVSRELIAAIDAEYEYCTKLNKRSNL